MNKLSIVLLCIIFVLVGGICGFFISNHMNMNQDTSLNADSKNEMVGTYKTSTWNGKDAVLVLNADGTCIHPTGSKGTWSVEGDTLHLDIVFRSEDGVERRDATIVPSGVMLSGHFFEKL